MMIPMDRMHRFGVGLAALGVIALGWACAGKSSPTSAARSSSETVPGVNRLTSIHPEDAAGVTRIVIDGSQPMSPNIFQLSDPDRIIVDLPGTILGDVAGPISVGRGGVTDITVDQFDDDTASLSRIVVGLERPAEYRLESDGTRLSLNISGAAAPLAANGVESLFAPEPEPFYSDPAVDYHEEPLAEPAAATLPPETELHEEPFVEPVVETAGPAKELRDVQYSASGAGTLVTLVADGFIRKFEDMTLKNPPRLVIDIEGIRNAFYGGKNIPLGTPEVSAVRLGESAGRVRVVLDLGAGASAGYSIDQRDSTLIVNVASGGVAPEDVQPSVEAVEDFHYESAPVVEMAPAPRVAPSVRVTSVKFNQLRAQRLSRVTIGLNDEDFEYDARQDGPAKLVVSVRNARFAEEKLSRPLDTRSFASAVTGVSPSLRSGDAEIVVSLSQEVPWEIRRDGANLYLDVTVPEALVSAEEIPMEAAPRPAPPAVTPPPAATRTDDYPVSESTLFREEMILSEKDVTPARDEPKARAPRTYRNVREEFMSDSLSEGLPLSDMGAILAGEVRGRKFTGRRISLDFKDADIRSIFRLFAEISKLNLIISDDVKGRITVRLDNVPWDQAFAIILQTKGLWFERYANIVRIAPTEKLQRERELAAAAERAAQAAKPLDVLFKPVSYATAAEMTAQVKSVLSPRGTVDIDQRTNTLIIRDIRENLEKARRMVEILDTQTPQVSIEARIVEANTNYTRSFGVIWGGQARFSSATGNPTGLFFPNSAQVQGIGAGAGTTSFSGLPIAMNYSSPLGSNAGIGIRLGSINNIVDLDLALGLLETQGHAKLISSPKITVLDNESATISAGSKIPFLTQTANAGSNVRFESATTSLTVTPSITSDGAVLMTIDASRNEPNFAQLVQGNPLVDQRQASTKVLVKSGNTTVLGGIYSIRTGTTKDSLPYVSSIPIIGWLFRNYLKELKRTELLIFVTPRIVGDEREPVRDIRG